MVDNDHNKHDLQSAYHSELKGVVCKGSSVEVTAVWGNMTVSVPLLARFSPLSSLNNFCSLTLTCAYQGANTSQPDRPTYITTTTTFYIQLLRFSPLKLHINYSHISKHEHD